MDLYYYEEQSTVSSVTGNNNKKRHEACEDVTYIQKTSEIRFYGLADGQTGKEYCRIGGKEVLKAIGWLIVNKGITRLMQYEYLDELQYEIIRVIRETISSLAADKKAAKEEYASTIMAFACDARTGSYLIVHLGDGGVIGCQKNGELKMLSPPENGLTANYTWLTTSRDALPHLRLSFGHIRSYDRIVMFTDGAEVLARGKNIPSGARQLMANGTREDLAAFLSDSNPSDDASCIVVDFRPVCDCVKEVGHGDQSG